jgi:murein DD-endopeptidase MepM/ murein hydrolase activator NlpD
VDLAAVDGAPVLAAGNGTVIFAGMVAGHGVVSVIHEGGLRTTYEPVSATVSAGQRVTKGQQIATVQAGHSGCPVAVCLHWGAFRSRAEAPNPGEVERNYVDPRWLVARARVRLLPIDRASDSA